MRFKISPTTETNLKSFVAFAGLLTLTGFLGSFVAGGLGVYFSLGLTTAFTFTTLWFCREISLWLMGAKEVKPSEKPEGFDLNQMVDALCQHPQINLKTLPKICVIESDKKNAFATGRHKNHTAIAITTGLLKEAKEKAGGDLIKATRWIEAIWCHELGHIVNHDVATKSTISILASSLRILSESLYDQRRKREKVKSKGQSNDQNKTDKDDSPSIGRIVAEYLMFYWIIPFTGTLLSLCLSRAREYAADDMAKKCGRAEDLAQAFEQLLKTPSYQGKAHLHTHHCSHLDALNGMLCLSLEPEADQKCADDLKNPKIGWFKWTCLQYSSWTSSHPPIEDRIKRLRQEEDNASSFALKA